MLSNSDLASLIRELLRIADFTTTTPSSLRRQLEDYFGIDLSDRKAFIREEIHAFIRSYIFKIEAKTTREQENKEAEVEEEDKVDKHAENVKENGAKYEKKNLIGEKEESDGKGKMEGRSDNVVIDVKKRGGYNKLCSLSPQLQKIVGGDGLSRPQVAKKFWTYIRDNNLQDPKDRRNIICDESLHALFHVNSINMFQMSKILSKHFWPLNVDDESIKQRIKIEESNGSESEEDDEDAKDGEVEKKEGVEEQEEEDSNQQGSGKDLSDKMDKTIEKKGGGFNNVYALSPQLQKLVGVSELTRTEVFKRLLLYIRDNNLLDPKNKQNIICDESLYALFRVANINVFQMNKMLFKHIWPLDKEDASPKSAQREEQCEQGKEKAPADSEQKEKKQHKQGREEGLVEPKENKKQPKIKGLFSPLPLSDALVKFLGTGESVLPYPDVIGRMWEYIRQNNLQDPSDERIILCDSKLRELFNVGSLIDFTVSSLLAPHFIKADD